MKQIAPAFYLPHYQMQTSLQRLLVYPSAVSGREVPIRLNFNGFKVL